MAKPWKVALACLVVALLGLTFLLFDYGSHWVGHTDLRAVFVVTDADSGRPVPSAAIEFRSEGGGFCAEDREASLYSRQADASGKLVREWSDCMCFGTKSLRKDTFAVHLPWLWFRASAPGYVASEWAYLDGQPYHRALKRGKGLATLHVKLSLRRTPPNLALQRTRPAAQVPGNIKAIPRRAGPLSLVVRRRRQNDCLRPGVLLRRLGGWPLPRG
ncbi:hypothetical protein [Tautonia marina]|uniref:hypothetical protein n=1 Tax=Tautonia marina TaxID=2653855 RepID=UPI0012609E61|nr:hypothetical protein [Tautonia marina]